MEKVLCVSRSPVSPLPTPIAQDKFTPTAMAVLQRFGQEGLAQELLAADGVHHLGNLLSLSSEMRSLFGGLDLWFEATDVVR